MDKVFLSLQLTLALLKIANGQHVDIAQVNTLTNQAVAQAQGPVDYQVITPVSPEGITVPTSTVENTTTRVFLPSGSMYSVWDAPKF